MSQTGNKIKCNDALEEMVKSGLFRVNSDGRVETTYQWRACREYLDRPWFVCDRLDGKGYFYVSFRNRRVKAHRLAYFLYHGEHPNDKEINHIDGVRTNNRKENLELCDAKRQSLHAYMCGLNKSFGESHPKAKLTEEKVRKIRDLASIGMSYKVLAGRYGVTKECIRYACIRYTWKHVV